MIMSEFSKILEIPEFEFSLILSSFWKETRLKEYDKKLDGVIESLERKIQGSGALETGFSIQKDFGDEKYFLLIICTHYLS